MLLLSKSLAGGASQQTGPSRHIDIPPERMMKRWDVLGTLQTAFRYHDVRQCLLLIMIQESFDSADAQGSSPVFVVGHSNSAAHFHIGQSLITASGPCRCNDLSAIRKGHVGDQLLSLSPPLTVDGCDKHAALLIEYVLAFIKAGLPELSPGQCVPFHSCFASV